MEEITIRGVTEEDLQRISLIHQRAFPGSALTKLGIDTIRRYYHWQLTGPHDCYSIIAENGQNSIGFCFGGVFRGALGGFLKKNQSFLFWRVLTHPWLLFNEIFRDRITIALRSLRIFPQGKQTSFLPQTRKVKSYGILSIAVDPHTQSRGVGRALMSAAETDAIEKGFQQMHLSVSSKNQQAINFYSGLGWVKKGDPWAGSMIKTLVKDNNDIN